MRLAWTGPALQDRAAIYDYIETDSPRAAVELDLIFARAAERLLSFPHMGCPGRVAGTREWVAHPHYVMVYEIAAHAVTVIAVLHTSRQYPPLG